MKIEKIDFDESITSKYDLKPVKMDRLGKVVLIAGKNGSGKSRMLEMLKEEITKYPKADLIENWRRNIIVQTQHLNNENKALLDNQKKISLPKVDEQMKQILSNQNLNLQVSIKNYKENISEWQRNIDKIKILSIVPSKEDNSVIDFVPKSLELSDSYTMASSSLDSSANVIYVLGTNRISLGTIPAITRIQKKWVNASVPGQDLNISINEKEKINNDYAKLQEYIKIFLGTNLMRDADGNPQLFGKRIGEAKLSDGQKVLLQFCLALYAQEENLDKLIIFMDEPENHLHPAALIEVLDKITPHVKNGQLWIATHSINITAHFDPSSIWYIDKGEISYAGNVPQKVLEGLLGPEEEIEKLSNFLSLPALMANTQYAYESLFYPKVVLTGTADPQVKQIHEAITEMVNSGNKLKVLDFGMGKGRLLSTIFENERLRGSNVTDWLDFYGYDVDKTYKDICEKIFIEVYGDSNKRYFNEAQIILTEHDNETFDAIVMCNVFHEIDPSKWLPLFKSDMSIFSLLKEDGKLIIVEDQLLSIGENAHSKGFLVFDSLEFKTLFKITTADNFVTTDHRGDGRLKAHHLSKKILNRIDADSKKDSLKILNQNAKEQIKKIRNEPPSFKNGKLHGFWLQQMANSALALEEL